MARGTPYWSTSLTPNPGLEGLKNVNVNNVDKVIPKIKNYIGQLSSPSPLGEGDRRG